MGIHGKRSITGSLVLLLALSSLSVGCARLRRAQERDEDPPEPAQAADAGADADSEAFVRGDRPLLEYDMLEANFTSCESKDVPAGLRIKPEPTSTQTITTIECMFHEQCNALRFGRCQATVLKRCSYPRAERRCDTDADCTAIRGARCGAIERICAQDTCEVVGRFCTSSAVRSACGNDGDCNAAPGGKCEQVISSSYCRLNECLDDDDCDEGASCQCELGTFLTCKPSE